MSAPPTLDPVFQPITQADIVRAARTWLGTPYHHQACCKGAGADCLGLVRGVWRDCLGSDVGAPPSYSRDWAEASGIETMLEAARHHLVAVNGRDRQPGDVLIFRLRPGVVAKHAGIVVTQTTMLHAMEGGPVAEVALSSWWCRRIAGVFAFPFVEASLSNLGE